MVEEHDEVGNMMLFQQLYDMEHDRTVHQGDHRLRQAAGERLDTGTEPPRHNHGFHNDFAPSSLQVQVQDKVQVLRLSFNLNLNLNLLFSPLPVFLGQDPVYFIL
jgi:hypothetical protein